jgi:DNA-binding HxlR family transcriptional regulator
MNERLQKMLRFHILERTVAGSKPPLRVEYRLTPFGRRFLRILSEVRKLQEALDAGRFGERHSPSGWPRLRPGQTPAD